MGNGFNIPPYQGTDQNNPTDTNVTIGNIPEGYAPPRLWGRMPGTSMLSPSTGSQSPTGADTRSDPYVDGDEYAPSADLNAIPEIQAEMVAAGLLDKADVRLGVWDAASAAAYRKVLEFANWQGIGANDALTILTSNPTLGQKQGSGQGPQQPVESFTNPADVQAQYRSTSQSMTGQEQDTGDFTDYYHGLESAANASDAATYYSSIANAGKMGSLSKTRAPTVQGAAEDYLLQHKAAEVAGYGVASRMNDFFSMLGGQ